MILVDTVIWADHIGVRDPRLEALIDQKQVRMHPFVIGEVSLGNLKRRRETLQALADLPRAPVAEINDVATLIERQNLAGTGVGYVDAHLLASVLIMPSAVLWTRDKRLRVVAERMGVAGAPKAH